MSDLLGIGKEVLRKESEALTQVMERLGASSGTWAAICGESETHGVACISMPN